TVVCKLFNMVQPDVAIFGEKDFQQLAVIRAMVRDLNIPVRIEGVATVRESDGLAMSSRNGYLTEKERGTAPMLYRTLCSARDAVLAGRDDFGGIEKEQCAFLNRAGFVTDYFTICRSGDLQPAAREDTEIVILAAARLGRTRLIDNIRFSRG
ncbi:MAG: 4-phosphopantoate--beta-alanine ligase, partial [Gammaproteobacteria bacterium]